MDKLISDLAIINGNVITLDINNEIAEAIAIKDGKIIYVGNNKGVENYIGENTKTINAEGNTVLPGLIDTHIHLVKYGFSLDFINLRNVMSISQMKKLILERVKNRKADEWIIGRSWDQEMFSEKRYPNRYDLDDIAPDNPVFLIRICGHVAIANSKALEIAGINRDTPDPPGGIIEKDRNGKPTGILKENALDLVYMMIPPPKMEDYMNAARRAINDAVRHGLTMVHFVSAYPEEVEALQILKEKGELKIRVRIYYDYTFLDYLKKLKLRRGFGDDMLKINGIKIITDGSLGGRTAALKHPYNDDPENRGKLVVTYEKLREVAVEANKANLQLAMHAIGDRALENVLNAVETALEEYSRTDHRHRVEHAAVIPPELLEKMKNLRMVAAVQPRFIISDFWTIDRLGEERASWIYPFKTMLKEGIIIGGGSDAPVDPLDPIYGIYSAVTRGCVDDIALCRYTPEEKLSLIEGIKLYTKYAAYLGFDEDKLGSIEIGKYADLVILSENILKILEEEIKDASVKMTVVNGKVVYK